VTDYDDAVRVVAEAFIGDEPDCPDDLTTDELSERLAAVAVAALVAAGWGDLNAERERLAAVVRRQRGAWLSVEDLPYSRGRLDSIDAIAHLIRETPEETS
jgi:hypothetical protein